MQHYGEYIRALREAKNMTLREVEKLADVSNAYLSQLESGKVKQPSPLTLHKLSEIYGVSYDLLMEKVGYPTPERKENVKSESGKTSIAYRIGHISDDEELELLNYLKFIRTRKK
ncbi:helix-turn-helix transcriptional regulator [Ferruginibacter paludis]|uniref:helix-turn-helix domain-containing protein n=1 Tax=Ferruginibacter paludis TaxID=1310417 RepID=UPI0025B5128D|nr:helix-turn-helix transcriptional regulator [Ferruginibacter paludis]MDN3657847.1 helix-turn-helix transcriptional regulator [Ferruginibacter paludis]